jgi:general secretion pathway protein I
MYISRDNGFTLLEVLVALVIVALALVVMFRAGGGGLVAANTASRYGEAVQRAQSHLAAVGHDVALLQGESEGDDGGGFRWRLRISPIASRQAVSGGSASATTLFDIDVAISWRSASGERSVILRTRRLGTTAPEQ